MQKDKKEVAKNHKSFIVFTSLSDNTNQTKQMTITTKDKFHNANGTLTMYSFGCGYVERYGNEFPRAVISREPNGWHVKGFDVAHVHFWEIFDTIKEARNFAKRITK